MEIVFSPIFVTNAFIQAFFIVLNRSSQTEIQLGFGSSSFLPSQPHDIFVHLLSGIFFQGL